MDLIQTLPPLFSLLFFMIHKELPSLTSKVVYPCTESIRKLPLFCLRLLYNTNNCVRNKQFGVYVVHLHIFGLWDENQTFKMSEANIENYFLAVHPRLFCVKQTRSAFYCYGLLCKKQKAQEREKQKQIVTGSGLKVAVMRRQKASIGEVDQAHCLVTFKERESLKSYICSVVEICCHDKFYCCFHRCGTTATQV